MDDGFLKLFDLISTACGVYILYTYVKLRMVGRLFPNSLLVPNGQKPSDCVDEAGYIRYLQPRLLIIGAAITLLGLAMLGDGLIYTLSRPVGMVLIGLALAFIIWYGVCSVKANRRYW